MQRITLVVGATLAACGGGGSSDAGKPIDVLGTSIAVVSCTGSSPNRTISTDDDDMTYSPSAVTIQPGEIVKFTMSSTHNVTPNATGSDPAIVVPFGGTVCITFPKTGTFGFHCSAHNFQGTVTVQ